MHEEAEAVLATPPKQPIVDTSAESWPHIYDVYRCRLYIYIYIHICGLLKASKKPTDWAAKTGVSSIRCSSNYWYMNSWNCGLPEPKQLPLPSVEPLWGFIIHYHSFKSFSYHCMQDPSTEYLHGFSTFHFKSIITVEQYGMQKHPTHRCFWIPFLG